MYMYICKYMYMTNVSRGFLTLNARNDVAYFPLYPHFLSVRQNVRCDLK